MSEIDKYLVGLVLVFLIIACCMAFNRYLKLTMEKTRRTRIFISFVNFGMVTMVMVVIASYQAAINNTHFSSASTIGLFFVLVVVQFALTYLWYRLMVNLFHSYYKKAKQLRHKVIDVSEVEAF
jgi:hypothetical protein